MRTSTRLDHETRIEEAVRFILTHLDEPLTPTDIADQVCLSRFHFHRVFQVLLGETVGELNRRIRLERAAHRLRTTRQPVTEIAFDAGYSTHEAFIRAFRDGFGITPSGFRSRMTYNGMLPCPNGVHYGELKPFDLHFVPLQGTPMNVEIREMPAQRALCMSHKGPYYMIGATFARVGPWLKEHEIKIGPFVGLYYDDPNGTAPDDLRSDAGALVDLDFTIDDPAVHVVDMPAATYAVYTHIGAYDRLNHAWDEFMTKWFPTCGYEFAPGIPMEIYIDDCADTPAETLRTELCISVRNPRAQ